MPAASIVNGRTGRLRNPDPYRLIRTSPGSGLQTTRECRLGTLAARTVGRQLHVCEFWLPGDCNLRCTHCYVAPREHPAVLTREDYAQLVTRLVTAGAVDVVVPGMEPLLRAELWTILEAAARAGARSIGMTTNGTLLARNLERLDSAPLTVINVSVDGPESVHDSIRGRGVFRQVAAGIRALRRRSRARIITNTTLTRTNFRLAAQIAQISRDLGADYCAFHPFVDLGRHRQRTSPDRSRSGRRLRRGTVGLPQRRYQFRCPRNRSVDVRYPPRAHRTGAQPRAASGERRRAGSCSSTRRRKVVKLSSASWATRRLHSHDPSGRQRGLSSCRHMARTDWAVDGRPSQRHSPRASAPAGRSPSRGHLGRIPPSSGADAPWCHGTVPRRPSRPR